MHNNHSPYQYTRALLIDDNPTVARVNQRLLREYFIAAQVDLFYTGRSALAYLHDLQHQRAYFPLVPELILLDLCMPRVSGEEFVKTFEQEFSRSFKSGVALIILSAELPRGHHRWVKRYSFVRDCWQKPLTPQKLQQLLQ